MIPPEPPGELWDSGTTEREEFHGVVVAPTGPFNNHCIHIERKGIFMTFPHFHGWVISPTLGDTLEGSPYLVSFNTLFSESLIIENLGTYPWVSVNYKGHH